MFFQLAAAGKSYNTMERVKSFRKFWEQEFEKEEKAAVTYYERKKAGAESMIEIYLVNELGGGGGWGKGKSGGKNFVAGSNQDRAVQDTPAARPGKRRRR